MAIKVIGSNLCPDTINALEQLSVVNQEVNFVNITEDLAALKEYLSYRDNNVLYDSLKENGRLGIPLFVLDKNNVTLNINDVI